MSKEYIINTIQDKNNWSGLKLTHKICCEEQTLSSPNKELTLSL